MVAQPMKIWVRSIETTTLEVVDAYRSLREQPRVLPGRDRPWRGGPQSYSTALLDSNDGTIQSLHIHHELIAPGCVTEKHGHQSDAALYVLEGRGYDVHDGKRYDWKAGDLVLVKGSTVHQHFNSDERNPARAIAIKAQQIHQLIGLTVHYNVLDKPEDTPESAVGFRPEYWPSSHAGQEAEALERGSRSCRFFDARLGRVAPSDDGYVDLGDTRIVSPDDMPSEDSAHGKLRHLLNERMGTGPMSVEIYIQEISAGSRSGRHRHPAEEAFFVLEGRGYDLHWDTEIVLDERYERVIPEQPRRFDWQAGDLVVIPSDVVHQHFNADPATRARILSVQSTIYKSLGYEEIEQLEDAPR